MRSPIPPRMCTRGAVRIALVVAFLLVSVPLALAWKRSAGPPSMNNLPSTNFGSFEGGPTGTYVDAGINNYYTEEQLGTGGGFDVPSGAPPSPLFNAQPFTSPVVRFEEIGTHPMPASYSLQAPLPRPASHHGYPEPTALDTFLLAPLYPEPTRETDTSQPNPWKFDVETFIGRSLDMPLAEGRPLGEPWAHQLWTECPPERYVKMVQTGARTNTGLRDNEQRHGYMHGEFGPGGLYHQTAGTAATAGTTAGIEVKFHPTFPVQENHTLWTFDGTFPAKLVTVPFGQALLFRHHNALPIDPTANRGFGIHTISTHLHNGHNPGESDGSPNAFYFPGQFWDYRWPLQLAGFTTTNQSMGDPRAGRPDGNGGIVNIAGDYREIPSTHWFHDHMFDFTSQNVYKGNAGKINYFTSVDRGNEGLDDGVNLRLPSGTALDWGNRDYDVNLLVHDKCWDPSGQLWFNIFDTDTGMLGDQVLVNWQWRPYMDVRARKYRFRILNASIARYLKLALVDQNGTPVPFHMISNDGNIMEHAIPFDGRFGTEPGVLPVQGNGERCGIIVDFSNFAPGDRLYMVNLLEHKNGKGPDDIIDLQDVISGDYEAVARDDDGDGVPDRWIDGDPGVAKILEFRVQPYSGTDLSMDPATYEPGGNKMIEVPTYTSNELANARHRTFSFGRSSGTDRSPWTVKTDGGQGLTADTRRISARPAYGSLEIWHFENGGNGWSHPIHAHFEEAVILRRGDEPPPSWEKWARKDVFRVGPLDESTDEVEVAIRFRDFAGTFVGHCHNTVHEDHAMLYRWDINQPGQLMLLPTPIPTWDGVGYVNSVALPTFLTGDGFGPSWK